MTQRLKQSEQLYNPLNSYGIGIIFKLYYYYISRCPMWILYWGKLIIIKLTP